MPVPILLYHHIGEAPPRGTPSRSNYVSARNFAHQMHLLKRLGFHGLSLKEAVPYIRGHKHGRVAAITFDDGMMSVYEHAMPVLDALGFTATVFCVANQIGGQNDWDAPHARRAPCMGLQDLRDWVSHGHEAGSHTLDHVHLTRVEPHEARRQITQSKHHLEEMLKQPVVSFAYPYGDENTQIRAFVGDAGYHFAATTRRSRARNDDNRYGLPRHSVRRNDRTLHFLVKCLLR